MRTSLPRTVQLVNNVGNGGIIIVIEVFEDSVNDFINFIPRDDWFMSNARRNR